MLCTKNVQKLINNIDTFVNNVLPTYVWLHALKFIMPKNIIKRNIKKKLSYFFMYLS